MKVFFRMTSFFSFCALILLLLGSPAAAYAGETPDPNGGSTGTIADVPAANPGEPTLTEIGNAVGHNKVAINFMWTLITGFLVMFMQAGFAMVESGLTRAKNASHTFAMNFMIYPLGMLGFYLCGFAFMFGGIGTLGTLGGYSGLNNEITIDLFGKTWGLIGWKGFMLQGAGYDTAAFTLFLFQMVFMDTTATIPTGAAAERWKFSAFMLYGAFIGTIMYPIFGNWVWGGGWLAQLGVNAGIGHGHLDFAGSSVVHMQGGVIALIFAWLIGPRYGKYNKDGSINPITPHSIPMVMVGTFILAFGWFGFNPGSTLAGSDFRIAIVAVNTMIAGSTAAVAATLWLMIVHKAKPDPSMMANGLLAGLVAITAPCAFVGVGGAAIIGIIAGILVIESVFFFDRKKIDDPVGAISVHGVNGAWGCLALGLFADGTYGDGFNGVAGNVTGLFYGGGGMQLLAEFIGVTTGIVFVSILSIAIYKIIDVTVGNRVSQAMEIEGLDLPEMGVLGYNGFAMDKAAETHHPRG
ncbi:MAG: ammonium transporter [Bacteroidota bacterium]